MTKDGSLRHEMLLASSPRSYSGFSARGFGEPSPLSAGSPLPSAAAGSSLSGHTLSRLSVLRPQAKLTVNTPGDRYEQEADAAADRVLRMEASASFAPRNPLALHRAVQLPPVAGRFGPWPGTALAKHDLDILQREDVPDPPDPPSAREKEKPGGPTDWGDKGLTCGIGYDGKFTCNLDIGQGDPLSISKPDGPKGPSMPSRPKNCPEKRWNWMFEYCCGPDKMFDPGSKNCVRDSSTPDTQMPPLPLPDHSDWGDYPVPAGDTGNA